MGGKIAEGEYREQRCLPARAIANNDQFPIETELVGQVHNGLADAHFLATVRMDCHSDRAEFEGEKAVGVADIPSHDILLCLILCHGRLQRNAQPPE